MKEKSNISSLTSLRFFAALAVIIHHLGAISSNLYLVNVFRQVGWLGVSFFFILSGFVLMWSFDETLTPSTYILRRLARIYPLHLVCLFFSVYFFLVSGIAIGGYVGTVSGTIANFFLIQDWIPGHPNIRQAWNGVSWTLSCELFFYIAAPFIFPVLIRFNIFINYSVLGSIWLLLFVVINGAQLTHWNSLLDFYQFYPLPRSFEFFLGAVGAHSLKAGFRYKSKISAFILMILPVLIYCDCVPETARCADLLILLFIPGSFLFIIATAGNDIDTLELSPRGRFLVHLGDASFSLYMIHALILGIFSITMRLYFANEFYSSVYVECIFLGLFILFSVISSLLIHTYFEHPTRRALVTLLKRTKQSSYTVADGH